MVSTHQLTIGIDIGGTYIKSGLVTRDGEVIEKDRWPIRKTTREELFDQFEELIQHWHGRGNNAELIGVGIGVPGFINRHTGILDKSPNLPAADGSRIFDELRKRLSIPAEIDNDANAAAWGEYWTGAGGGSKCLFLVTLGTGIGSGLVLDGEIWHGAEGYAGEFGHTTIVPDGEVCNCGNRGCIEAYFSASSMIRDSKRAVEAGQETSLASMPFAELKGIHVLDAAESGDAVALEIVSRGARLLGLALSDVINLLNPDQIVIGGGISAAADLIMPLIKTGIEERAIAGALGSCTVRASALGNDAGLIGSAGLAWRRHDKNSILQ